MLRVSTKNWSALRGVKGKGRRSSDRMFWEDVCNVYRASLVTHDSKGGKVRFVSNNDEDYPVEETWYGPKQHIRF